MSHEQPNQVDEKEVIADQEWALSQLTSEELEILRLNQMKMFWECGNNHRSLDDVIAELSERIPGFKGMIDHLQSILPEPTE